MRTWVLLAGALLTRPAAAARRSLVVVNDVSDPVSLDPHREFDASSDNIVNQIFDGLVRLSPSGEVEPALATSWRRVDDLTLEFTLRDGVVFHDGEPFTAEAVKFSLDRQLDPAHPAANVGLVGTISGVEIVDAHTVRIKTKVPDGVLLNKLPMFVKILPPKYIRERGDAAFAAHPVGTGPFEFVQWRKGREIELAANKRYWMKGVPRLDRVTFRFLPSGRQLAALQKGDVDMITDLSGLDTLKVASNRELKVLKAEDLYAVSMIFNSRKAPLSDLRLREALTELIDTRDLIRYGARGNGRALDSFTIPGEFGRDAGPAGPSFDRGAALRLLHDAIPGRKLHLKVMIRDEIKSFGLIMVSQFRDAGIDVDYEMASQEKVYRTIAAPKLSGGGPGWDGDVLITHYVDPTAHVYFPYMIFIHSKGPYSLARDDEFDALFDRMVRTIDAGKQEELCHELEGIVESKALAASPVQVIRPFAFRRGLRYQPYVTGMLDFRTTDWEDQ